MYIKENTYVLQNLGILQLNPHLPQLHLPFSHLSCCISSLPPCPLLEIQHDLRIESLSALWERKHFLQLPKACQDTCPTNHMLPFWHRRSEDVAKHDRKNRKKVNISFTRPLPAFKYNMFKH